MILHRQEKNGIPPKPGIPPGSVALDENGILVSWMKAEDYL